MRGVNDKSLKRWEGSLTATARVPKAIVARVWAAGAIIARVRGTKDDVAEAGVIGAVFVKAKGGQSGKYRKPDAWAQENTAFAR